MLLHHTPAPQPQADANMHRIGIDASHYGHYAAFLRDDLQPAAGELQFVGGLLEKLFRRNVIDRPVQAVISRHRLAQDVGAAFRIGEAGQLTSAPSLAPNSG